jgi:hypothetical protein
MSERIIYAALFVLILLVTIHAVLHVFEIEHPNIPEWLFPGGLTLTATQAYASRGRQRICPSACPQRYSLSRAPARTPARHSQKAVNALAWRLGLEEERTQSHKGNEQERSGGYCWQNHRLDQIVAVHCGLPSEFTMATQLRNGGSS